MVCRLHKRFSSYYFQTLTRRTKDEDDRGRCLLIKSLSQRAARKFMCLAMQVINLCSGWGAGPFM